MDRLFRMPRLPETRRRIAVRVLVAVGALAALGLLLVGPIPQPDGYHPFADTRPWFGIPNGADVFSNAPFLAVGLTGFAMLRRARRASAPPAPWAQAAFGLLAFGIALTAIGSAIYHLAPSDRTLVFDRLPMSISFGAFAAAVVGERLGARAGRMTLVPAVVLGIGSVVHWAATIDGRGGDDLRLYAFVQYFSVFTVIALVALVPDPTATRRPLVFACAAYGLAKLLETFDASVFRATGGFVSGHTLKHLAAAVATAFLVRWFRRGAWSAARSPAGAA